MSQTKQECMEYIIVLLDDMKSEVNKIMHKNNYQTYDSQVPDLSYLQESVDTLFDEIGTLEIMFENCIPEEVRTIRDLNVENENLKDSLAALQEKLKIRNDI